MLTMDPSCERQENRQVVSKMQSLLSDHIASSFGGVSGNWVARLVKKTGGGGSNRVEFKRLVTNPQTKEQYLLYGVRPFDRDSSWHVAVFPPQGKTDEIIAKIGPRETETQQPDINMASINIGQLHSATITAHLEHGLCIRFGQFDGFIPLADISQNYDSKDLNKYPVGKTVKVVISSIDSAKSRITCSIHSEFVARTDNPNDFFTGIPDQTGYLSLKGFCADHKRVFEVLGWLAYLGDNISHDDAMEWVIQNLMEKYSAKSMDRRGVAGILTNMSKGDDPLLNKNDNRYTITEFGYGEIGGREKHRAIPETKQNTVPEPEPEPAPTEPQNPEPEPEPEPEQPQTQELSNRTEVIDYIATMRRLVEIMDILASVESLKAEKASLEGWLASRADLREEALKLFSAYEVIRARLGK